jgi:uncharacterized membrane protein
MSDLIAVAYPDEAAASRARENLADGARKGLVDVEDVLVRELVPERVLPHIHEHGRVIHTSLSGEVAAQLDSALSAARRTE